MMVTDVIFNSNAIIVGENLTYLGMRPGYQYPSRGWINPYWMRTISLTDQSKLIAHGDLSLSSNGGYYNTGLYLWKSEAELNGKTFITMQNRVDTTRVIYDWDGGSGTTKATFNDDLIISLTGSDDNYTILHRVPISLFIQTHQSVKKSIEYLGHTLLKRDRIDISNTHRSNKKIELHPTLFLLILAFPTIPHSE